MNPEISTENFSSLEGSIPAPQLSAADRLRASLRSSGRRPVYQPRPQVNQPPTPVNKSVALLTEQSLFDSVEQKVVEGPAAVQSSLRVHYPLRSTMLGGRTPAPPPAMAIKKPNPAKASKPKVVRTADESRTRLFKQLDITRLGEMLLCVPTSYMDCRNTHESIYTLIDGFKGLFFLQRTGRIEAVDAAKKVVSPAPHKTMWDAPYYTHWRHVRMLKVELKDKQGKLIWVTFFDPWRWKNSDPQGMVLIDGTLQTMGHRRMLINTMEPPPEVVGKVWARYNLPGGPKEEDIRLAIGRALQEPESFDHAIHSLVTNTLLSERQLLDLALPVAGMFEEGLREFFTALHQPADTMEGDVTASAARVMAVAGICNAARASSVRYPHPKAPVGVSSSQVRDLIKSQPEVLTSDQAAAVEALVTAIKGPQPLNCLLSGDVGTGKTLAYLIPAVATHLAGGKVALVSPTEILANQLFTNLKRRFPMARVERVHAGGKIRDMGAILVGTSGLGSVTKKHDFTANFLVVDEQHKLSTKDRNSMVGPWTHHLEASATPIPRSLAATLFNGTQVLNLSQAPVARQIESFVMSESERAVPVAWMRDALDKGHRVAVIYPRVEKFMASPTLVDDADLVERAAKPAIGSVIEASQGLEKRFPGRVGMLHGKLLADQIAQTLDAFRAGTQPIVVASTIMETGIDIPDIRLLIVKNAENFGAAQLHQLRGRLARNGGAARFVMMVGEMSLLAPETQDRLVMVSQTNDGYALAEADMKTRGFGDMAGLTQSGQVSSAFRLLKLTLDDFSEDKDDSLPPCDWFPPGSAD